MRRSPQFIAGLIALTLSLGATAGGAVDFAKDVQPILERRCLQCHGPEEQNGGIRYDHRDGAFAEADSGGRAIVPGKPEQSQLVRRITSTHKDDQMPPKGERLPNPGPASAAATGPFSRLPRPNCQGCGIRIGPATASIISFRHVVRPLGSPLRQMQAPWLLSDAPAMTLPGCHRCRRR